MVAGRRDPADMFAPVRRIGLFLRGGSYAYQDEIIGGVHQECVARGINLYCLAGGNIAAPDPRNFVYALPAARDLDAAIIAQGTLGADDGDPAVVAMLGRLRPMPILTIGARESDVPCVTVDNSSGVRLLTRHLIEEHGRRRIAFVAGHGREAERRFMGYSLGHRDCGLAFDARLLIQGDFQLASGQEAVRVLFDGGGGCDAIVAANDWMALGAIEALAARRLRVPEDVAVVGFDDIDEARFATPPLTTVRQPPRQLGIEAVRAIVARAAGDPTVGDLVLHTVPQIRQSCGCFRGTGHTPPEPVARAAPHGIDMAVWATAVAASGPAPEDALPGDWPLRLATALRGDLDEGKGQRFLATLDAIVSNAAEVGNVSVWHQPVAALRREAVRHLGQELSKLLLADSLFERAHILIGDHAERVQGRRRLEAETTYRALRDMGREVLGALDRAAIGRALAAHLANLRVAAAAVVVNAAGHPPAGEDDAHLIVAWDHEHGLRTFETGFSFRAGQLAPEPFLPPRRHTLMIQPLCFNNEARGWCVFEMDTPRAIVCEEIPQQLSVALEAAALRERLRRK